MSSNDNVKIAAAAGAGVVAVGGAAVVGKKLLSKSPEQRQQALAEKSMETDKVLFHMFPRAAFSPSHSPYCTCVEAYFRANKIPYEICEPDLKASPNGCVPYVAYRGQVIADSQKIMQWASIQFNITTDVSLSRDMQAESKAIRSMIEYSFMPALVRSEFVDNKLRVAGPFMSNSRIVRWFAARAMKSYVTSSQDVSGYSLYDKDQYENLMLQDVQAVETILRDRPFLVGQTATMVDFTAYSMFIMVFLLHDRQPSRHTAVAAAAAVPEKTQAPHPQQERQMEPFTGEEPFLHPEGTEAAAAAAAGAEEDNTAAAAEDLFVNTPLDYMVHSQPIRDYINRMTELCYPDMGVILPPPAFAAAEAKARAAAEAKARAAEAAKEAEAEGPVDRDIDALAGQIESIKQSFEHAPAGAVRSLSIHQEEEKTAAERKAAWDRIREILPRKKTPEDKKRRIALFKKFDADGSKSLTIQETYQGLIDYCQLDEFTTRLKDITLRAFNKAKDLGTKDRNAGDEDQVEFLEFRLMLCYIYDYFELTVMFDEIDADGSMMIDMDEFKAAVPRIAEWGVQINDPEATFRQIDANGSGKMTFDEFCSWASAAKLDADGDPDNTAGPGEVPPPAEEAPVAAARGLPEEKTAAERKTAWDRIREILPRKKTPEDKKRRIALFKKFDADGSKSLTLDETYQGLIDHCQLDEFTTRLKDITLRAFNKAKDLGTKDRNAGDEDQVEFLEFRLMLCYIYDYFELTVMFDEIDADGSMMIDMDEFKAAVPRIAEWGVQINDPEATFRQIDANGSGKMTFDEFCSWASAAKLDADGDPDNTEGGAAPNAPPA